MMVIPFPNCYLNHCENLFPLIEMIYHLLAFLAASDLHSVSVEFLYLSCFSSSTSLKYCGFEPHFKLIRIEHGALYCRT
jgi:hypothetical protein